MSDSRRLKLLIEVDDMKSKLFIDPNTDDVIYCDDTEMLLNYKTLAESNHRFTTIENLDFLDKYELYFSENHGRCFITDVLTTTYNGIEELCLLYIKRQRNGISGTA